MSVDVSVNLMLGVRVELDKLSDTKEVPADTEKTCCSEAQGSSRFCPSCGESLINTECQCILPGVEDIYHQATVQELGDTQEIIVDIPVLECPDFCIIGERVSRVSDPFYKAQMAGPCKIPDPHWEEIRRSVMEMLEPFDLWDGGQFGLWTTVHISY